MDPTSSAVPAPVVSNATAATPAPQTAAGGNEASSVSSSMSLSAAAAPAASAVKSEAPAVEQPQQGSQQQQQPPQLSADREMTPMEQQRLGALDKMDKIVNEFTSLKDKYFADKRASIMNEMELIETGKHEQFAARDALLVAKQKEAVETASRERSYQIRNAQLVFETEMLQAEKELALDRKHLKKKMREALEQRLEELEEERRNVSVVDYNVKKPGALPPGHDDAYAIGGGGPKKKKIKPEMVAQVVTTAEGRKRRINPPHVNYTIREPDIYSDLHMMRRASMPRNQLENILYDVYASGNDALIYFDKHFDVGQVLVVTDREGRPLHQGVVEVVSPIELRIKLKTGATQSIELSKLRDGELCLARP